jgi:transaldolase
VPAFADHGRVSGNTISGSYDGARLVPSQLAAVGIDIDEVTEQLEREGLDKFEHSWGELRRTVAAQMGAPRRAPPDPGSAVQALPSPGVGGKPTGGP